MKFLNNITSLPPKTIIPALLLTGGIIAINRISQNTISNEQNLEYMANNPASLAMEAGLFGLFCKRRRETEIAEKETQLQIQTNNDIKDWNEIRKTLFIIANDFLDEKEEIDDKIDKLIEKLDTESVDKELGEYAKQGLNYIKKCTDDRIEITEGCIEVQGLYIDESNELFWSVYHATKSALYPNLVTDKEKQDLPKWIERGKVFMDNH